jgi:hypothetical protein
MVGMSVHETRGERRSDTRRKGERQRFPSSPYNIPPSIPSSNSHPSSLPPRTFALNNEEATSEMPILDPAEENVRFSFGWICDADEEEKEEGERQGRGRDGLIQFRHQRAQTILMELSRPRYYEKTKTNGSVSARGGEELPDRAGERLDDEREFANLDIPKEALPAYSAAGESLLDDGFSTEVKELEDKPERGGIGEFGKQVGCKAGRDSGQIGGLRE